MLSREGNLGLTTRSTNIEVKEAIWECEGSKSLGPNEFNFNLIGNN